MVRGEDRGTDMPARDAMLPVERTRAGPFLQVDHSEGTAVVEPLDIEQCPRVSANNQLRRLLDGLVEHREHSLWQCSFGGRGVLVPPTLEDVVELPDEHGEEPHGVLMPRLLQPIVRGFGDV